MELKELIDWAQKNKGKDPRADKILAHERVRDLTRHGNPEQRFDQVSDSDVPVKMAGVVLPVAGEAVAGPIGAGIGNMAGGALERWTGASEEGTPGTDFLWGAGPSAAIKGAGAIARKIGNPRLAKAVGYLLGKPTDEAAAGGGVKLDSLSDPQLQKITSASTPGGAQRIAAPMAANAENDLTMASQRGAVSAPNPALPVNQESELPSILDTRSSPGQSLNEKARDLGTRVEGGRISTAYDLGYSPQQNGGIPATDIGTSSSSAGVPQGPQAPLGVRKYGQMADQANQLGQFVQPPGPLSGLFNKLMGNTTPRDPAAARYLSAVAQAKKRGLALLPELEQALQNMPGQSTAAPLGASGVREYEER